MTVPVNEISDTSQGIYKLTGPCSMSSPCPGDTCPEHGQPLPPPPVVTATEWEITTHDDRWLGLVCLRRDKFWAMCSTWREDVGSVPLLDAEFDTLAEAVAAILEAKK